RSSRGGLANPPDQPVELPGGCAGMMGLIIKDDPIRLTPEERNQVGAQALLVHRPGGRIRGQSVESHLRTSRTDDQRHARRRPWRAAEEGVMRKNGAVHYRCKALKDAEYPKATGLAENREVSLHDAPQGKFLEPG